MSHRGPHYFDVTLPLTPDLPVWPGDDDVTVEPLSRIAQGGSANVTSLKFTSHVGTHVDAPWHFIDDGAKLNDLPIDRFGQEVDHLPRELGGLGAFERPVGLARFGRELDGQALAVKRGAGVDHIHEPAAVGPGGGRDTRALRLHILPEPCELATSEARCTAPR